MVVADEDGCCTMCKSSASNQKRLEGRNGKKMIKTILLFFLNIIKKKALGKSRVGSWHVNRVCKWS